MTTDRNAVITSPPVAAAPEKRASMRISFRGAVLFAAAIFLLMFLVYNTMELSRVNSEFLNASSELQRLKREEGVLARQSDVGLSLSDIEAYAVGELGMVHPSAEQFVFIGNPARDHAEVIRHENIFARARKIFSAIGIRIVEFIE